MSLKMLGGRDLEVPAKFGAMGQVISIPPGWGKIVKIALENILKVCFHDTMSRLDLYRLESKFGVCRAKYVMVEGSATTRLSVKNLFEYLEKLSGTTCEVCGDVALTEEVLNQVSTLCKEHLDWDPTIDGESDTPPDPDETRDWQFGSFD